MGRRLLIVSAVLAMLGTLVGGLAHAGDATDGARASAVGGSDLFVRTADGGTLRPIPGRKSTYRLALKGLGGPVTVFTDRPQRKAGSESTAQFVRRWRSRGFSAAPPNAALVLAHGKRRQDVKVFELSRPRLRKGILTFTARDLGRSSTKALAGFGKRADKVLPRRFTRASLFIDPSDNTPQVMEFKYTYVGNSSDDASLGFEGQSLDVTNVDSTGGTASVRANRSLPAFVVLTCHKFSAAPCTVTIDVVVTPARSPVTVLADPGSEGALTARFPPVGPAVPLDSGRHTLVPPGD
jgi:hypothetical protein